MAMKTISILLFHAFFAIVFTSGCGQEPRSHLSEDPRSFTIVTYNVQSRPVLDLGKAIVNLPLIGAKANDYQVIGFQECFSVCSLLLKAAQHVSRFYFDQKQHWWNIANSGLASLSVFPLIEHKEIFYQAKGELADTVASKGVILMRYQLDGKTLDIYNTHMQAGNSQEAGAARVKQGEELIRFIRDHSPSDHAVILHGDFNMGPQRPGKRWEDFRPNHYSSEADMIARTAVFNSIIQSLGLIDVSDSVRGAESDEIDRILYRSGDDFAIKASEWADKSEEFRDSKGQALSDSTPVFARFIY